MEPPLKPKRPNVNSLRAVLIYLGSCALVEQLHELWAPRNTDGQLEEDDAARYAHKSPSGTLVPGPGVQSWTTAQEISTLAEKS